MPVCPNCRNGRVVHWRNQRIGFCSSVLSFEQERKERERVNGRTEDNKKNM